MNYKGKADLTLHCLYSNPRRMVILPDRDVEIESCDSGTKISVELGESGLTVDEIDVSVSGNILNGSTLFVRQPANQVPLGIVLRACFITIQCKLIFSTKGYQKYTGHYIWKESQECVYPNLSYSI